AWRSHWRASSTRRSSDFFAASVSTSTPRLTASRRRRVHQVLPGLEPKLRSGRPDLGFFDNRAVLSVLRSHAAARVVAIAAYVLVVEWTRALAIQAPGAAVIALVLGGAALGVAAVGWPAGRLGLGTSRLGLRLLGGVALVVADLALGGVLDSSLALRSPICSRPGWSPPVSMTASGRRRRTTGHVLRRRPAPTSSRALATSTSR